MDADQALRLLGSYSKWQMRSYLLYGFGFGIPLAWMWMAIIFIGDTPNYHCNILPNVTVNESIPETCDVNGQCQYDKCLMYQNVSVSNKTEPCKYGYWYDPESGYESTLVSEFNLVCGKNWLVELSMTAKGIGSVIGGFTFALLSDRYGRKIVFLGCMWSNAVACFILAFSVNIWMFSAFQLISGLLQQGMITCGFVLALELFPTEQRTFAGVAIEFFWALGYILIVPIAFLLRDWRHLQLAITCPLVFTVLFYWYMPESLPYLLTSGKKKQAEAWIKKAAKFSGVIIPDQVFITDESKPMKTSELDDKEVSEKDPDVNENIKDGKEKNIEKLNMEVIPSKSRKPSSGFLNKLHSNSEKTEKQPVVEYKLIDMFKSKKMLLYSVCQWFIWLINSLGYNAIAFTVTYLPGNRYVNFLLYAVMEIPAYAGMWLMLYYAGRRITICVSHLIGGIALLGMIVQLYDPEEKLTPLIITLSMLGKVGFTFSYGAIYVQTPELYPTSMRNTGLGICGVFAKAGTLVSPYFRVLARVHPVSPSIIVGGSSILAGLLALVLPETRHEPLPDTIEEVEGFQRSLRRKT